MVMGWDMAWQGLLFRPHISLFFWKDSTFSSCHVPLSAPTLGMDGWRERAEKEREALSNSPFFVFLFIFIPVCVCVWDVDWLILFLLDIQ